MRAARTLLLAVSQRGVRLSLDGDDLVHRGPRGALDAGLIARLKACKAEIVAELRRQTEPVRQRLDPADVLERAAWLEFGEGLSRAEADARALAEAGLPSWEALELRLADHFEVPTSERTPHDQL